MTELREHVSFEELNDYVDGRLDERAASRVAEHLAGCESCSAEHEQLTELLSIASSARISIDPGDDLWSDVRKSIDSRKEVVLPVPGGAPRRSVFPSHLWNRPAFLAAAAVFLIVASSWTTTIVLRTQPEPPVSAQVEPTVAPIVLPASFRAAEAEYGRTIRELQLAVEAQRSTLNPETIRTIDHSLAVVDTAIAEARAALVADPNNRTLVDLVSAGYQRKLDLLRRTSELSPKT